MRVSVKPGPLSRRVGPQMTLPGLVLVHGGAHAADCWDLTIAELACREPGLRVLAVDLPGRGRHPADLATVTVADWVGSVAASLRGPLAPVARFGVSRVSTMKELPGAAARFAFCNAMPSERRKLALARLYPESVRVIV